MTPVFLHVDRDVAADGRRLRVANMRGGSEYGEAWHQAGMLGKKQNVFDDFIAAAEYLNAKKYTSTAKLAIEGRVERRPAGRRGRDAAPRPLRRALPGVGVLDMLRFDKFTIGNAWIAEYGCSTCGKADFAWLYNTRRCTT